MNDLILCVLYRPPSQEQTYFFDELGKAIDHYGEKYENFILVGDFNAVETDQEINDFMNLFDLKNLVRDIVCSNLILCVLNLVHAACPLWAIVGCAFCTLHRVIFS